MTRALGFTRSDEQSHQVDFDGCSTVDQERSGCSHTSDGLIHKVALSTTYRCWQSHLDEHVAINLLSANVKMLIAAETLVNHLNVI